jgi:6-phosphofructokinase
MIFEDYRRSDKWRGRARHERSYSRRRTHCYSKNFEVIGFERGWEGLLTNTFRRLTPRSVGGILHLGGTILHTSRCLEFKKDEAIKKAAETLALNNVEGLVVIGGNGSLQGALELSKKTNTLIAGRSSVNRQRCFRNGRNNRI